METFIFSRYLGWCLILKYSPYSSLSPEFDPRLNNFVTVQSCGITVVLFYKFDAACFIIISSQITLNI
jgi:hypothetical protein